jgi:hypothetical protein
MPLNMRLSFVLPFAIGVSLFGSFTTLMLAFYPPLAIQDNFLWRKPLTGLLFTLICVFGIVAVFFPKKCSETSHSQQTKKQAVPETENRDFHGISISFKGHHPNCGRFSAHVAQISGHVFCAACTGLLFGAFIALAGTALNFFVEWNVIDVGLPTVLVGQIGVLLGFVQFKFKGYARLTLNTFFVFACFLTLVGIDKLAKSIFINLYTLALITFWLLTRILISQWDHWKICHTCKRSCELK